MGKVCKRGWKEVFLNGTLVTILFLLFQFLFTKLFKKIVSLKEVLRIVACMGYVIEKDNYFHPLGFFLVLVM